MQYLGDELTTSLWLPKEDRFEMNISADHLQIMEFPLSLLKFDLRCWDAKDKRIFERTNVFHLFERTTSSIQILCSPVTA